MASSKIKGITIEIGGNTTKLQDALKGVDKQVYSLNGDLKALNQALKLDPTNTELLAQKHEVLARNIQATKERLETLKEAQRQMGDYNKLTDEQKASYNQLSLEIAKSESALKSMNAELKETNKIDLSKVKDGLKKVGDVALDVSKKMLQITTAVGTAITGIITAGVKSYAELEKAQKGSQRLFGESYSEVEKYASEAYKTMGLSATEYYDQVNTYAVGLKNALGKNSSEAAKIANGILIAQADIVAATGASQDQVQSAFAAVMRGNYTMLDNLRLGIKGSKQGMEEVIKKVNAWNKAEGHATKYRMGNYADMQKALIDYTKMVGVAGTASQQMSDTIQGSLGMLKSAFNNFLNGSGSAKELSKTISIFLKNIIKALKKIAPDIVKGLVSLLDDLAPQLGSLVTELLPIVIEGVKSIIDGLIKFINSDSKQFIKMAIDILTNLVQFIIQNLPLILQAAIKIITELARGLGEAAPILIPAIIEAIFLMAETLIDNIDILLDATADLIEGILKGIIQSFPKILEVGFKLVIKIGEGIINAIPKLLQKGAQLVSDLATEVQKGVSKMIEVGKNLAKGIFEGMYTEAKLLTSGSGLQTNLVMRVANKLKSLFGISSPSKLMRDEIGVYLGLGIVEGINDTVGDVENAMSNLSAKVEESVNPTINPTANSNPLYITIDKFYNNRETDVQQLAEELEFYRKNSALAKGGV